jgi:DNA-binding transcriptional ArsR family regulator
MNQKQIISSLKKSFDQIAIPGLNLGQVKKPARRPEEVDLELDVKFGGKELRLFCEVKSDARSITVEKAISQLEEHARHQDGRKNVKPCLIVPFLPEAMRRKLRSKDISFIDLSGNVYINDPGLLHIEREGKPNMFVDSQLSGNIFADKRSLVLRYLFAHPNKFSGVREIAQDCGANPGGVSVALKLLEEAGYVARDHQGRSKLVRWRELLEDWASYYKVKKQSESRFYWNAKSLDQMVRSLANRSILPGHHFALTGHAGAYLVAPHVNYEGLHAYVQDQEVVDELAEAFKMRPAEKGANVILLHPYYKESVFYGARKINGVDVVSDIQLYLDLKNFPVRGEEQAENLVNRVIAPSMEPV